MLANLAPVWWMLAMVAFLLYAALGPPSVEVGGISLNRTDASGRIILHTMGGLGILLLAAVAFAVLGNVVSRVLCKWWGAAYSFVLLALGFALLGIKDVALFMIMLVFSGAWYWGASRAFKTRA